MCVELEFDKRIQEVMGGVNVVVDGVVLVAVALHRVGGGTLLGKVNDGIRTVLGEPLLQELVVLGEVDQVEMNAPASFGVPDARALLDRVHRGQRLDPEFGVDPPPRKIVEDMDLMPRVRKMQ